MLSTPRRGDGRDGHTPCPRQLPLAPEAGAPLTVTWHAVVHHLTPKAATGRRQHRSFRFAESTLERLDARAKEIRETRTALAERYVDCQSHWLQPFKGE